MDINDIPEELKNAEQPVQETIDQYPLAALEEKGNKLENILAEATTRMVDINNLYSTSSSKSADIDTYHSNSAARVTDIDNYNTTIAAKAADIENYHSGSLNKATEIDTLLNNSLNNAANIENYHNNISVKSAAIDTFYTNSSSKSEETELYYGGIKAKNEAVDAFYVKFEKLKEDIENSETGIEATRIKSGSSYQNILKVEADIKISNQSAIDAVANVEQIKEKIVETEIDINVKKATWEDSYQTLFNKIEGLLPGATSTGLAKSYDEQGKKYVAPYIMWSCVFVAVLVTMIGLGLHYINDIANFTRDKGHFLTTTETINLIVERLPFFIPAVWLAVFASKQQSQNRRLREEYSYKETLAKSYESYKREVDKLPESENKQIVMETLLKAMVDMSSYNPSQTLQHRGHAEKPPFMELLNKAKPKE